MATWDIKKKSTQPEPATLSQIIFQLLKNRDIPEADMLSFLSPSYDRDSVDSFLFSQMHIICEKITETIKEKQHIVIHGDYDADGVCSSILLCELLQKLGAEQIDIFLPHRDKEGYGLNMNTVHQFIEQKKELVITVDCGSTSVEEIALLKQQGIPTIVLDHHHEPEKLPEFYAALNPHFSSESYPFKHLCSTGVVFKLIQAFRKKDPKLIDEAFEKWSLDLVAIATVADCMELVGENRTLVSYGLTVLQKTQRIGLRALIIESAIVQESIDTYHIGFMIAPRINAAGRMEHANTAIALLMEKDFITAQQLAKELNTTNQQRQTLTDTIYAQAVAQVETMGHMPKVIVVHQPFDEPEGTWPVGLVGLVAGKLVSKYHRPSFVIGTSPKGYLGSGRSIPQYNIIEAIGAVCPDLFANFGGHAQACGFTFKHKKDIDLFCKRMNDHADAMLAEHELIPHLAIDAELSLADIGFDIAYEIKKCAPYGIGNPHPLFCTRNLEIMSLQTMGSDLQHLKMTLSDGVHTHQAIGFRFGQWAESIALHEHIDIAYEININEWNGHTTLQLRLVDIKNTDV